MFTRPKQVAPAILVAISFSVVATASHAQYHPLADIPSSRQFSDYTRNWRSRFNPQSGFPGDELFYMVRSLGCRPLDPCGRWLRSRSAFDVLTELRYIEMDARPIGREIYRSWFEQGIITWPLVADGHPVVQRRGAFNLTKVYSPYSHYLLAGCGPQGCAAKNFLELLWIDATSEYDYHTAYCISTRGQTTWLMAAAQLDLSDIVQRGTPDYEAIQYLWIYHSKENDSCIKPDVQAAIRAYENYRDELKDSGSSLVEERIELLRNMGRLPRR